MGIEHERIHIETSAVLLRQLPVCMVEKPLCFVYGPMQGNVLCLKVQVIEKVTFSRYLSLSPKQKTTFSLKVPHSKLIIPSRCKD